MMYMILKNPFYRFQVFFFSLLQIMFHLAVSQLLLVFRFTEIFVNLEIYSSIKKIP